jgi:exosortase C (VPDSG-CTERM-specific)
MGWVKWIVVSAVVLCVTFAKPLYGWMRFSWGSDLYSHCLLIPFVSAYFFWSRKRELQADRSGRGWAIVPAIIAVGLLALYWNLTRAGAGPATETALFLVVTSFLCLSYAVAIWVFGWGNFRRFLFPALFLMFMAPLPAGALEKTEAFLQHGSAVVAHGLFAISGMPVLRDATFFQLPGIRLQVAPECSGIHSTLVLLITSVLAGYVFLKAPGHRAILTCAVIPLALLRNGFRIFTVGQLCVHYGPQMFHSYIHRRGGPIFFALALVPLFFLMWGLLKWEKRGGTPHAKGAKEAKIQSGTLICTDKR